MEITGKKVITVYDIEIGLTEFWENLQALVDDFKQGKAYFLLGKPNKQKKMEDFVAKNQDITLELAKDLFYQVGFAELVKDIVVEYIAHNNGYNIKNYGYTDTHLKLLCATFQRDGSHI